MKNSIKILLLMLIFQSCKEKVEVSSFNPVNWEKRTIELDLTDTLTHGTTYLSVYSQIYSHTEHRTHDLTETVNLRNVNTADTNYINNTEYFNTMGNSIRTYFNKPIFMAPMETVEIIIDERNQEGATGANFLFEWAIKPNSYDPFFEAIMISTSGLQGLSFTTQGKRIK